MCEFTIDYTEEAILTEGKNYIAKLYKLVKNIREIKKRKSIEIVDILNNRTKNKLKLYTKEWTENDASISNGSCKEAEINLDLLLYALPDSDLSHLFAMLEQLIFDSDINDASLIKQILTQVITQLIRIATMLPDELENPHMRYQLENYAPLDAITVERFCIECREGKEIIIYLKIYEHRHLISMGGVAPSYLARAVDIITYKKNVIPPVTPMDDFPQPYDANIRKNAYIDIKILQLIHSWLIKDSDEKTTPDIPTIDVYIDIRNINTIVQARETYRYRTSSKRSDERDSLQYSIKILDVVKAIRNYINQYIDIEPTPEQNLDDVLLKVNTIFTTKYDDINSPFIQLINNILTIFYSELKNRVMSKISDERDDDLRSCFLSDSYEIEMKIKDTEKNVIYMYTDITFQPMRTLSTSDVRAKLAIEASVLDEHLKQKIMRFDADTINFIRSVQRSCRGENEKYE